MAIPKAGPAPRDDLAAFLTPFATLLRRRESRHALECYTTGLLSDVARKTAAELGRALPTTNGQQLQEFLTRTAWDPGAMDRRRIEAMVARAAVGAGILILDDTGFAKQGAHSVGVARQYSGTLGRVDNCQVLVTAHYVDRVFDWPVGARLYLPESWASDPARRARTQVPTTVQFQTKGLIALTLIDEARAAGVPVSTVVTDAGYGDHPALLNGLERRALPYVVGLKQNVHFRATERVAANVAESPAAYQGRGRPRKARPLADRIKSQPATALLSALPDPAWETIAWREGTKGSLIKQFVRRRVHRAGVRGRHHDSSGWLIGERPLPGHRGDVKYYFAWGLEDLPLPALIERVHVRWVIERFYQDAKGELGLDDYEGRFWPGLHRHMALVMLAHSYLTLRQSYGAEVRSPGDTPASRAATFPATARGFPPGGPAERRRAAAHHTRRAV